MTKVIPRFTQQPPYPHPTLSPQQFAFAEWLAIPASQRLPKTQKDLAQLLGVDQDTLRNWKNNPELWQASLEIVTNNLKNLAPLAIQTIEESLNSPNAMVKLKAATEILDRILEPKLHAHVIASIKDIYHHYQQEK